MNLLLKIQLNIIICHLKYRLLNDCQTQDLPENDDAENIPFFITTLYSMPPPPLTPPPLPPRIPLSHSCHTYTFQSRYPIHPFISFMLDSEYCCHVSFHSESKYKIAWCKAFSRLLTHSIPAKVSPWSRDLHPGESFTINCTMKSSELSSMDPTLLYFKHRPLDGGTATPVATAEHQLVGTETMQIHKTDVQQSDAGYYKCYHDDNVASILYTEVQIGGIDVSACDVLCIYAELPAFAVLTLNTWMFAWVSIIPRDIMM